MLDGDVLKGSLSDLFQVTAAEKDLQNNMKSLEVKIFLSLTSLDVFYSRFIYFSLSVKTTKMHLEHQQIQSLSLIHQINDQ